MPDDAVGDAASSGRCSITSTARPRPIARIDADDRAPRSPASRFAVGSSRISSGASRTQRPGQRDAPRLAGRERPAALADPRLVAVAAARATNSSRGRARRRVLDPRRRGAGVAHRDVVAHACRGTGSVAAAATRPRAAMRRGRARRCRRRPRSRAPVGCRAARAAARRRCSCPAPLGPDQGHDLAAPISRSKPSSTGRAAPGFASETPSSADRRPRPAAAASAPAARPARLDQVEDPLGGGEPVGARVELRGERPQRRVELGGEQQHRERGAERRPSRRSGGRRA